MQPSDTLSGVLSQTSQLVTLVMDMAQAAARHEGTHW